MQLRSMKKFNLCIIFNLLKMKKLSSNTEKIEVYDLSGNFIYIQDRKQFYEENIKEFLEKGYISRKTKTIRALLMTSKGDIYIQKRSYSKNENPGLYDKAFGGHVVAGNSFGLTVMKECIEELGFTSIVVSKKEFRNAINIFDLEKIGIFKKIDHLNNFNTRRIINCNDYYIQPLINDMYIGYYDGSIKFSDGECCGIEILSLDRLKNEISNDPNRFTEDLIWMINEYQDFIIHA